MTIMQRLRQGTDLPQLASGQPATSMGQRGAAGIGQRLSLRGCNHSRGSISLLCALLRARPALAPLAPAALLRVRRSQPSTTSDGLLEPATAVEAPALSSSQLARPWVTGLRTRQQIMQTCSWRFAPGPGPPAPVLDPVVPTIYDRRLPFGACISRYGSCTLPC
jgi:hypothetical protein